MIVESPSESRRFGLKVGRVEVDDVDAAALQAAVLAGAWDCVVLRLPCGGERGVEALRLHGLEPQQTDTLMTWSIPLAECGVPMPSNLQYDDARPEDATAIAALVQQVFRRYPNHYTANPLLDAKLALEGYVEWALSHIGHPQRLCWVVRSSEGIAALSCSQQDEAGVATGVLHGVHPAHAGRGLYRGLIEGSLAHYRTAGCSRFRISTQAGNHTVQNLWARLGLRIESSRSTVHLMPLLGRTLMQPARPVGQGGPLQALWAFDAAIAEGTALRRSLYRAAEADLASGARLRALHWPGESGRSRRVSLLTDTADRPLAWLHSDLLAPSAPSQASAV